MTTNEELNKLAREASRGGVGFRVARTGTGLGVIIRRDEEYAISHTREFEDSDEAAEYLRAMGEADAEGN